MEASVLLWERNLTFMKKPGFFSFFPNVETHFLIPYAAPSVWPIRIKAENHAGKNRHLTIKHLLSPSLRLFFVSLRLCAG